MSIELENKVFASQIMDIAKEVLTEKQYDIVSSIILYSVPKTVLAKEYGVSSTRIYQIEAKALRILRYRLGAV